MQGILPWLSSNLAKLLANKIFSWAVPIVISAVAPVWAAIDHEPAYRVFVYLIVSLAGTLIIFEKLRSLFSQKLTASVRFRFFGDSRFPEIINQENIFRYYFLKNQLSLLAADGTQAHGITIETLYISFDKDVEITTLQINSPDQRLPTFEVKEYNQRYAIISFHQPISMGTLELRAGFRV